MTNRFDEFWTIAPRKRGKGAARKAYAKALTLATEDEIIAGARRWRQESIGKDPSYVCHPATWLNQERWEDEPDQIVQLERQATLVGVARVAKRAWARGRYPADILQECVDANLLTKDEMEAAL